MTPTDLIAVTLNAQAWDTVMRILADAPYRISAPLIGEIQRQCMPRQEPAQVPSEAAAE
jgi:16S rRNA A1518/A1519 N6-dimethyltransferase RsmA/KsgA/DIM1 with predicted DNA glycosylase/AP lyase activity